MINKRVAKNWRWWVSLPYWIILLIPALILAVIDHLGYFFEYLGDTVLPYIGNKCEYIIRKVTFLEQVGDWVEAGYEKDQELDDDL